MFFFASLLADEHFTVKVCDFGLSTMKQQDRAMTAVGTAQVLWLLDYGGNVSVRSIAVLPCLLMLCNYLWSRFNTSPPLPVPFLLHQWPMVVGCSGAAPGRACKFSLSAHAPVYDLLNIAYLWHSSASLQMFLPLELYAGSCGRTVFHSGWSPLPRWENWVD